MADNPKKTGKADRDRIAGKQAHEVGYEAKRSNTSRDAVRAAVKKAGPMRKDVRAELAKKK